MKTLVWVLALAPMVLLAQIPRDGGAPAAAGTGVIAGTVVSDDATARPVRRAVVTIAGGGVEGDRKTVSDDQGRFSLTGLPPGRYTLSASKAGWVASYYGSTHPGRPAFGGAPVVVKTGQQITGLTLRLLHGSVLTGTVSDPFGHPVPEVQIELLHVRLKDGQRTADPGDLAFGSYAASDDRGLYRLYGVAPGDYVLAAQTFQPGVMGQTVQQLTADALTSARRAVASSTVAGASGAASAVPGATREPTVSYALIYYPGTTDLANATTISVGKNEEKGGLDMALVLVHTVRIQGQTVGPDGQPIGGAQIQLVPPATDAMIFYGGAGARSGSDGRFQILAVTPGAYQITARAADPAAPPPATAGPGGGAGVVGGGGGGLVVTRFVTQTGLYAAEALTVGGEDMPNVMVQLQRATPLTGHLIFAGPTLRPPADLTRVRIALTPAAETTRFGMGNLQAQVDGAGAFRFPTVPPGRYRVDASVMTGRIGPAPPSGWLLRSAMVGEVDAVDHPFEIALTGATPDLAVTFTDRLGEITGSVTDAAGHPVADYRIIVFSADRTLWGTKTRRMKEPVATDPDGTFRVENLMPGNYFLAAVTDMEPDDLTSLAFLEEVAAKALPLTLGDGETKVQNLRVGGGE